VTLNALPPLTVSLVTPAADSEDVGSTYRPQVFFSRAVDANTLTADTFYATDTTGSRLDARIVVGDGGRFAWLFFANPMPGASVITVHLKSASIRAATAARLSTLTATATARPNSATASRRSASLPCRAPSCAARWSIPAMTWNR
jgi:hypothetical protein